jgi:hypothetical protein
MDLQLLKLYAISLIGTPYLWGDSPSQGDDPVSGFDCSGLASELARASGLVNWAFRANAQGLYSLFHGLYRTIPYPELGAFAFYGPNDMQINHVAFCLDGYSVLEAGGGDEKTLNKETAAKQNAFVRIRPWNYRRYQPFILKPLYPPNIPRGSA